MKKILALVAALSFGGVAQAGLVVQSCTPGNTCVVSALQATGLTGNSYVYAASNGTLTSTAAPTNGQLLVGSTGAAPALATLTGTSKQITVTNGAGTITLATPQNIDTGAAVTFASETLAPTSGAAITTNPAGTNSPFAAFTNGGTAGLGFGYIGFDVAGGTIIGGSDAQSFVVGTGANHCVELGVNNSIISKVCSTGLDSTGLSISGVALKTVLTGTTGSIGGGALLAGACTSGTVAVTSSTTSMTVSVAPNTYPGDGIWWEGYVSTAGTVTVKVCAAVAMTPTASTYNVRVIQ